MKITNIARLHGLIAAAVGLTTASLMSLAQAQDVKPLKIAVMDGFSGVYGDLTQGEVEAMQLAIEDVGGKVLGRPVEILSAGDDGVFELHVHPDDLGHVIGKQGRTARSLRLTLGAAAARVDRRVDLEIAD